MDFRQTEAKSLIICGPNFFKINIWNVFFFVETHCTKMGADSLAENTQIPKNLSAQFVCPSSKVLDFDGKRLQWACGVGVLNHGLLLNLETLKPGQQSTSFYVFDLSYADMTWQNRQWQIKYWRSFVFCISFVYLSLAVNLIYCHQHFAIQ